MLRFGFVVLLVGLATPRALRAQVSVYAEGSASDLQGGPAGDYLYGGTAGVLLDGPAILKRAVLSVDIQTRDVDNNGERLVGVAVGPRVSLPVHRFKLNPYGEFMVGFARYRASTATNAENTTDNQWQVNMGVSRALSSRLDAVADYSYSQYGANNGEYNPKSYSAGVIFHLIKR
jgi:opacity protein-like surface antigen